MTDRESMSGAPDCGGDAAAYALGALEPHEVDAFRRHLQGCAVCRDEVEALGGVVQALPLAARQYRAPRGLRRNVMREVRREQARSRPLVARPARPPRPVWRGRREIFAGAGLALAAAAAVIIAVGLPGAGGPVTVVQAQVSGIAGTAEVRVASGRAELIVRHLTPPGHGHIYEVWLQSGSAAPVPASVLFAVNGAGNADVGIPSRLHGVRAVLVTPEPLGGTSVPTHTPVIVARLA